MLSEGDGDGFGAVCRDVDIRRQLRDVERVCLRVFEHSEAAPFTELKLAVEILAGPLGFREGVRVAPDDGDPASDVVVRRYEILLFPLDRKICRSIVVCNRHEAVVGVGFVVELVRHHALEPDILVCAREDVVIARQIGRSDNADIVRGVICLGFCGRKAGLRQAGACRGQHENRHCEEQKHSGIIPYREAPHRLFRPHHLVGLWQAVICWRLRFWRVLTL